MFKQGYQNAQILKETNWIYGEKLGSGISHRKRVNGIIKKQQQKTPSYQQQKKGK